MNPQEAHDIVNKKINVIFGGYGTRRRYVKREVARMTFNLKEDLELLEIGFLYAKSGITLEEAKLEYLNKLEQVINKI